MSNKYRKVRIKGKLTTLSDSVFASGHYDEVEDETDIQKVCCDYHGKAYIPASTLRGYMRSIAQSHSLAYFDTLFGKGAEAQKNADNTAYKENPDGALRIYDAATIEMANDLVQLRSRTSIDPLTGTAKEHHLFTEEVIPPNSVFQVEMCLDNICGDMLDVLLQIMSSFSSAVDYCMNQGRLGKGASIGQGYFQWNLSTIEVVDEKAFMDWIDKNDMEPLSYVELDYQTEKTLENVAGSMVFYLNLDGPLLVNQNKPEDNTPENTDSSDSKEPKVIKATYQQDAEKPDQIRLKVPGSSLKGLVRGHCRKILLTILVDIAEPKNKQELKKLECIADDYIGALFGHTGQRSVLWFSDALSTDTYNQESDVQRQTFNAIDRFTGGVKDGALYTTETLPAKKLSCSVRLCANKSALNQLPDGWQGLLLLLLRDAMEGDLAVGWGKSKGYGAFRVFFDWKSSHYKDWGKLLKDWNNNIDLGRIIQSLSAVIDDLKMYLMELLEGDDR